MDVDVEQLMDEALEQRRAQAASPPRARSPPPAERGRSRERSGERVPREQNGHGHDAEDEGGERQAPPPPPRARSSRSPDGDADGAHHRPRGSREPSARRDADEPPRRSSERRSAERGGPGEREWRRSSGADREAERGSRREYRDYRDYRERGRGDRERDYRGDSYRDRRDRGRGYDGGGYGGYRDSYRRGDGRDYYARDSRDHYYSSRGGGGGYGRGGYAYERTREPEVARERKPSPTPEERAAEILRREEESARHEAAEAQRDEQTVLVQRVHPKADEFELFEFFSQAGTVSDIRVIKDQKSGRSKGVAYVEFADAESVVRAMALNGILFMGQPLLVAPSQADKNRQAQQAKNAKAAASLMGEAAAAPPSGPAPLVPSTTKLIVANLPLAVEEADVRGVLEAFGPLLSIRLTAPSGGGGGAREAAAEYTQPADAATAVAELNGYQLEEGCTLSARFEMVPAALPGGGVTGVPALVGGLPAAPPPPAGLAAAPVPGIPPSTAAAVAAAAVLAIAPPTECLVIRNLFDPSSEQAKTEKDFFLDLLEDVVEECGQFGQVTDACVDPTSAAGCLYLRFAESNAFEAARAAEGAVSTALAK